MNLSRRSFLKIIGYAAAAAVLPAAVKTAAAHAPWHKGKWLEFACHPLLPGTYTFSAHAKVGGAWRGLYVVGVKAAGGETRVRVPIDTGEHLLGPVLSLEGVTVRKIQMEQDFTAAAVVGPNISRGKQLLNHYGPVPRRRWPQ